MGVRTHHLLAIVITCLWTQSLAAQWSPMEKLARGGAIRSPGGTHPLVADGNTVHAIWGQGGAIHYRRSGDAGRTWTDAVSLTTHRTAQYPCSLELAGDDLHLLWLDSRSGGWELYAKRSANAGRTWDNDERLAPGLDIFRFGTAISGKSIHIVGGSRSRLEKVPVGQSSWTWTWGDIYHLASTDGGVTWTKPRRLNREPGTAMRPVVAVSGQSVHVAWFDQYAAEKKPGWDWDVYFRSSPDSGAHWEPEVRLTNTRTHTRHPQIVATSGSQVCCIWEDGQVFNGTGMVGDPALYAAVSSDDGKTWGETQRITRINAPNGFATHAKAYICGPRVHLTWQDAPEGPTKPKAIYYMTSADGGLSWEPPERLTQESDGTWETGAVVGSESWALVVMGNGRDLAYRRRDLSPAPKSSRSQR